MLVKHLTIASYRPSSNGAPEQTVQTFKTSLKKIVERKQVIDLNASFSRSLLSANCSPTELLRIIKLLKK